MTGLFIFMTVILLPLVVQRLIQNYILFRDAKKEVKRKYQMKFTQTQVFNGIIEVETKILNGNSEEAWAISALATRHIMSARGADKN